MLYLHVVQALIVPRAPVGYFHAHGGSICVLWTIRAEAEGCTMIRLPDVKEASAQKPRGVRFDKNGQVARAEPRLRTCLRTGWISDLARKAKIECLFMDISSHGARLRLERQTSLPASVLLFDDRSQTAFRAEVRWQRSNEVGVFIREGTLALRPQ